METNYIFCTNCGQELPKNSRFCFSCGTKIENFNSNPGADEGEACNTDMQACDTPVTVIADAPAKENNPCEKPQKAGKSFKRARWIGAIVRTSVIVAVSIVMLVLSFLPIANLNKTEQKEQMLIGKAIYPLRLDTQKTKSFATALMGYIMTCATFALYSFV